MQFDSSISSVDASQAIPRWVVSSELYPKYCDESLPTMKYPSVSPTAILGRMKDIMKFAIQTVLCNSYEDSVRTLDQQIYWTLILLRRHYIPLFTLGKRALRVYPSLQQYIRGQHIQVDTFHRQLVSLIQKKEGVYRRYDIYL